ncbi:MAG: ABC transporter ATP-binding protein [Lachnospiraceae bacterium]|jgi:iron complex transport system ATP-binding protein|nr:ABC transporter ATP-binding protein [Lachnospiraceae bacterium]MCI1657400.1 ABC transporter ATP-binding protein [Lachnospiraceae bacterium]
MNRKNSDTYISMERMSVGYNKKALIHDICIDIHRGDIVTLIGPNGAGKSTILKSLTRQLSLIRGKVIFDGRDLHEMSYKELSRKLAVVLTERMKPDLMTCADIVATGRYPYTGRMGVLSREDEQKVDDALAAVNASELAGRDFNAISDGQRQRILLARAICQEPEIIILDEPTSFLDIHYKLELLSILRRMAKEKGITVLMTLHEIDLAEKVSDKIICVHGDTIDRYGSPEEIFREETIRELYEIDNGFFDPMFGSIELPKPESGAPRALVISSGGSGIRMYRRLQKENIPFAAGILYPNDMDYALARLLAEEVVLEQPFMPIGDTAYQRALDLVGSCGQVIYCGAQIGTINRRILDLVEAARAAGKLVNAAEGQLPDPGQFQQQATACDSVRKELP